MKKIVFTICARNYYGLAQVLRRSVEQHDPDVTFLTFLADGISDGPGELAGDALDAPAILLSYLPAVKLREMAFKYNLTEFCTAIKPFCFRHLFDATDCDNAIYLDPDVFAYSSLDPVFDTLKQSSIVLTPHVVFPSLGEGLRTDAGIMATGIYNLGFAGLARTPAADTFLRWWSQRLLDQCFVDNHDALFTDQKWVDFAPALFPRDDVHVLRHAGANMAPWNFHEREVVSGIDGSLMVQRRHAAAPDLPAEPRALQPLTFVHFSGFDYRGLCEGRVSQSNIPGLQLPSDLERVFTIYGNAIRSQREQVLHFMALPYRYACFSDGTPIVGFHRRLYRSALDAGWTVGDPFAVGPGSFHARLSKHDLLPQPGAASGFDKANKRNLEGVQRKLAVLNRIMRGVKRIVGFHRYALLLRLMRPYSRVESQLHLIDPAANKL